MFIELHAQSAFSFLLGAEQPEALVAEAARLEMPAMALVDRDGVYGIPRFSKAAMRAGLKPIVGAEITLTDGSRLPLLVEDRDGYHNLCRLITRAKLSAPKGQAAVALDDLAPYASGLVCLTGGADGPLARRVAARRPAEARECLERLAAIFGRSSCFVEVQRHRDRSQERVLQGLVRLARDAALPLLASNGVLYTEHDIGEPRASQKGASEPRPSETAHPRTDPISRSVYTDPISRSVYSGRAVADVLTCIREKTDLDHAGTLLQRNAERGLKGSPVMRRLFADLPEAVDNSGELAMRLGFSLKDSGYRFPDYPLPPGHTAIGHLRELVERGVRARYGTGSLAQRARRQVAHELEIIARLDLPGYFLIVWDIVEFCRHHDILVQGRGSAANSAVCYALGITAVDPVGMDLLFERFLSEARGEWPDIDLDLPSVERRETVIQYVYQRYGRHGAAMTANVITYRGRSAAREVGKALGLPADLQDRLAKLVPIWGYQDPNDLLTRHLAEAGCDPRHPRIRAFAALWTRMLDLPRHLGQHSGGMVIAAGRLDEVVPLEPATMPGRVVVQWDKDDCADLGIIKVDLLGLRMMAVLQESIELARTTGADVDLARLPPDDPDVYGMLQAADTIGVFQVESRAQMATLPRIRPERFYDLVVQVAIIRPGPIVGDMVHPYIRRRRGYEPVSYAHPTLEPILQRTLGVPLFQEQLLRMAMATAGFTGTEAEELRRAFGFKRSEARMAEVEQKLRAGMARQGIEGAAAEAIVHAITSFALYGFPESHASSFALLAYASAYLKVHHAAAFYAALLNNQPMGFYHPATIIKEAQRRGQRILPVDVTRSDWLCTLEPAATGERGYVGATPVGATPIGATPVGATPVGATPVSDRPPTPRSEHALRYSTHNIRLGLRYVKGLRAGAAVALVSARAARAFASVEDLVHRAGLARDELETLAAIGALARLGGTRRRNLWAIARPSPGPLFAAHETGAAAHETGATAAPLREMTEIERIEADYGGTGVTIGRHPLALHRAALTRVGVVRACDLGAGTAGARVRVAGSVIVRQRPGTARGFVFLSLEDETGIANVIVTPGLFERHRLALVSEPYLLVDGVLQKQDDVVSVKADRVRGLAVLAQHVPSHDFG